MELLKFVLDGDGPIIGTCIYGKTEMCTLPNELSKQLRETVERQLAVNLEKAQRDLLLLEVSTPPTVEELRAQIDQFLKLMNKPKLDDYSTTFGWNPVSAMMSIKAPVVPIDDNPI